MYSIKKILVPTDFSDNAATAYNVAHKMASRFKAKVDFIHIIQTMDYYHKSIAKLSVPLKTDDDLYPLLKKQASARIKTLMDDYLKPEHKGEGIVHIAPRPSRAIAEQAEAGGYDLVLMATLGEHESNFFIGSVAEKVIRCSSVPVLSTGKSNLGIIQHILVPTDGSQTSLKALPLAISFALTFDATITLFNVLTVHRPLLKGTSEDLLERAYKKIREEIFEGLKTFFTHSGDQVELQEGENGEGQLIYHAEDSRSAIKIQTIVQEKISKYDGIAEYADEHADIVIMVTQGRRGLSHLLFGSVAEVIAKELKLPVVTVKPYFDE